ncbi:hypothetical protein LCGC14_1023630 [marine sediment metagenome]|uniref:Uncharacterized protein n=1 Tax=marine sediment metagenome TaxID=412755 RepID=A0A0F9MWS9_9ZZZZ
MKKLIILAGIFLLVGCAPVVEYVETPVYIEKIVEVVVEVEKIVEIEKIAEVPIELRDFESLEELREWVGEGRFFLFGDTDCDDYALYLQKKGMKDGYLINFEAILPDEYNGLFEKMEIDELHAINLVIIDNAVYYIEPQTREIVLRGYLD